MKEASATVEALQAFCKKLASTAVYPNLPFDSQVEYPGTLLRA